MLHIKKIRENRESYLALLKIKNIDATKLFSSVIEKDNERKVTQQKADDLSTKGNQLAKQITELYKTGKAAEASALKDELSIIKKSSKELQNKQVGLEKEIQNILDGKPNYPDVPDLKQAKTKPLPN